MEQDAPAGVHTSPAQQPPPRHEPPAQHASPAPPHAVQTSAPPEQMDAELAQVRPVQQTSPGAPQATVLVAVVVTVTVAVTVPVLVPVPTKVRVSVLVRVVVTVSPLELLEQLMAPAASATTATKHLVRIPVAKTTVLVLIEYPPRRPRNIPSPG